ncbi:MAG: sigma-70 family RNA polymerase sigma factor [Gemmatimonadales bacterium]|nr:MAG: sigma-70 family RNA polymerase sigma factor [Gemmatimonadales bacterium]
MPSSCWTWSDSASSLTDMTFTEPPFEKSDPDHPAARDRGRPGAGRREPDHSGAPTTPPMGEVTRLLMQLNDGDRKALDRIFPLVIDELKRIASNHLRRERSGHTLNTTALVHESYLSLVGSDPGPCRSRSHFFALASRAMRHLLIDHARRRSAEKRGGGVDPVTLEPRMAVAEDRPIEMLNLASAMERLAALDPRLEQVVECKVFGGMTASEIAEALDVSTRTVERDWARARAYLYRDLRTDGKRASTPGEN